MVVVFVVMGVVLIAGLVDAPPAVEEPDASCKDSLFNKKVKPCKSPKTTI
jgi:hypothetical protein